MSVLHVIDVARIAHETLRLQFAERAFMPDWVTASEWTRNATSRVVQVVLDDEKVGLDVMSHAFNDVGMASGVGPLFDGGVVTQGYELFRSVVNACRPFVED